MNRAQFDLIARTRFARLDSVTIEAVSLVIENGITAYAAEDFTGCTRGTVSRYVSRFTAEYEHCGEVMSYECD